MINTCMYSCTCCSPSKSYTEERNLYRHQRRKDSDFVEPANRRKRAYEDSPRFCACCGVKLSYETIVSNGPRTKYCSRNCSAKVNNSSRVLRRSEHDNSPRVRKIKAHGKPRDCQHCLGPANRNSRYCSTFCRSEANYVTFTADWIAGLNSGGYADGSLSKNARRWVIEQADYKCTKCGWGEVNPTTDKSPLNVDHIDGDSTNHRPENLKVLCPNCHSLTPTYGSLNIGNGRESRREYRRKMKENGRAVA
jgi:hypothetical protein